MSKWHIRISSLLFLNFIFISGAHAITILPRTPSTGEEFARGLGEGFSESCRLLAEVQQVELLLNLQEKRLQQQRINEYLAQLQTLAFTPDKISGIAVLDLSMLENEEEHEKKQIKKKKRK